MSDRSGHCEDDLCLKESNATSIRVFPCLYHCKKMLCIKHLYEHDKYMEQQSQYKKQLEYLWTDYRTVFNEEKVHNEYQKLKTKLALYYQLNREIRDILLTNTLQDSLTSNHERLEHAIETVQKAIENENQSKSFPDAIDAKIELVPINNIHQESFSAPASLSSSINTNDGTESIDCPPSVFNKYTNLPLSKQSNSYYSQNNEHDSIDMESDHDDDTIENNSIRDDIRETPNRTLTASKIRGYCPLTQDGAFGISCISHGIGLCSKKLSGGQQRTYCLREHFRRTHHLTPFASLTLARAIGSGQDPMTTVLFNNNDIILNIDELRIVTCPINKPFHNYPLLDIDNSPCDAVKQVRQLKDHLKRVHGFTTRAAHVIVKAVKADAAVDMIEFPPWISIFEDDDHF